MFLSSYCNDNNIRYFPPSSYRTSSDKIYVPIADGVSASEYHDKSLNKEHSLSDNIGYTHEFSKLTSVNLYGGIGFGKQRMNIDNETDDAASHIKNQTSSNRYNFGGMLTHTFKVGGELWIKSEYSHGHSDSELTYINGPLVAEGLDDRPKLLKL